MRLIDSISVVLFLDLSNKQNDDQVRTGMHLVHIILIGL